MVFQKDMNKINGNKENFKILYNSMWNDNDDRL